MMKSKAIQLKTRMFFYLNEIRLTAQALYIQPQTPRKALDADLDCRPETRCLAMPLMLVISCHLIKYCPHSL